MPRRSTSAVAQLDIGEPDDRVAAIIALINEYADSPATTQEQHVAELRGTRLLRAHADDAWLKAMARAYYAAAPDHLSLSEIGELNGGAKPMARSSVQRHVAVGLELLEGDARKVAETVKTQRVELVRNRGDAVAPRAGGAGGGA